MAPASDLSSSPRDVPITVPDVIIPRLTDFAGGYEVNSEELIQKMEENPLLSGVTFSGGEPFCQAEALVPIAEAVESRRKTSDGLYRILI